MISEAVEGRQNVGDDRAIRPKPTRKGRRSMSAFRGGADIMIWVRDVLFDAVDGAHGH